MGCVFSVSPSQIHPALMNVPRIPQPTHAHILKFSEPIPFLPSLEVKYRSGRYSCDANSCPDPSSPLRRRRASILITDVPHTTHLYE